MVSTGVKSVGRLALSMICLTLLYGGLLYVAVGALGVSELTSKIGGESSTIIHIVEVAKDIRDTERNHLRADEEKYQQQSDSLALAVKDLRDFGVSNGLALQDIQPIIDTYALAPKLADLLKRPVAPPMERNWADLMAKIMALQLDMTAQQGRIDKRHTTLRASWSSLPVVAEEANQAGLDIAIIDLAASTASTLQKMGYGTLFSLPAEILTLLLALSMGALGSTLHITKLLLDGDDGKGTSFFLIRPFQGMITSLVVFVLLKAGQLTISAGDSDNLNIFFVSFAGISSGLLAEEAYRMIKKAGAGIIKADDGESRWAFRLSAAMDQTMTEAKTLATGIGSTPAELRSWLDESQPVPPLQQKLIASWLHIPERDLFTSQPPG